MIHIDLFSGIGGFALAVDEVWPGSEHIFCEIDTYCQALLKKRFEGAMIYGDIRGLSLQTFTNSERDGSRRIGRTMGETEIKSIGKNDGSEFNSCGEKCATRLNGGKTNDKPIQTERLTADTDIGESRPGVITESVKEEQLQPFTDSRVDILTGGFPCQPFSQAGKRKGTDDNRYLWPEMLRVIRDFQPTWVIAENVRGILSIEGGLVFEQVCLDLEGEGYEVQAFVIPAVAVNAPHRRDRVWFVAHAKSEYDRRNTRKFQKTNEQQKKKRQKKRIWESPDASVCNAPDTAVQRCDKREQDDNRPGEDETPYGLTEESWQRNWLEVATEFCRVDDGLPAELDGLKLSKSRHRVERLKALGNAIVPQVAVEIMRGIKNSEDTKNDMEMFQ